MDLDDAPVLTEVQDTARQSAPGTLLGFCDALKVNRAYERSSWNIERYVQRMVALIDNKDTDPRIVLVAMETLRKHALETLQIGNLTSPPRLGGTLVAEVLPPADLALLEDMGSRTRSMVDESAPEPETHEETPPLEENDDDNDNENDSSSEDCTPNDNDTEEGAGPPKGGAEDGGSYDTEQVVGHRPPASARRGLCDVERPGR